jgi:hypothetical protein
MPSKSLAQVALNPEDDARIEGWRRIAGLSRSDALRILIELGMRRVDGRRFQPAPKDNPFIDPVGKPRRRAPVKLEAAE